MRRTEGTRAAFSYLARRLTSIPLLLAGCWRTDEPAAPSLDALARAAGERIPLGPLTPAEHRALVAQTLGGAVERRAAEELFVLGRGNPLFTGELVRQLSSADRLVRGEAEWELASGRARSSLPIPSSLQAVMIERLETLSDAGRGVLELAAVIGEVVPLDVLRACAGLGELRVEGVDELLDLTGEAVGARIVEETGLGYRFLRPLLREGVLRRLDPLRSRLLHGRVARTLEAAAGAVAPVESLAYHYREAGETEKAVAYLVAAGERAESVYDHEDAVRRFEEAIALLAVDESPESASRRAEAYERLGDVHRTVGRVETATEAYEAALAALGAHGGGAPAGLHRKIALGAIMSADIPTADVHLASARETSGTQLDEARNLIVEALRDWHLNRLEDAVERGERALAIAEREGAQLEIAQACEMLALAHLPQGNWEEGLRYELRREADWSPDLVLATDAHMCLWEYRMRGENPHRRARRFIDAVAEQATTMGNLRCLAVCHYALGSIGLVRGDFELGRQHLSSSLDLHERLGSPAGVAFTLARLLGLEADTGGDRGEELYVRALEAAEEAAVRDHALMMVLGAAMRDRLAAGDLSGAIRRLAEAERLEAAGPSCPVCSLEMLPVMAAVHLQAGNIESARDCAERGAQLAEAGRNQAGSARAGAVLGRIRAKAGDAEGAAPLFAGAADTFRALGHRYELATTLEAWGGLPGGSAARAEAEEILSSLGR